MFRPCDTAPHPTSLRNELAGGYRGVASRSMTSGPRPTDKRPMTDVHDRWARPVRRWNTAAEAAIKAASHARPSSR